MYSFNNRVLFSLLIPLTLSALPSGGVVSSGGAIIATPTSTTVTVATQQDANVINWSSFDLASGEHITFSRTGSNATGKYHVFNMISGATTSISGGVYSESNGVIYIVNPNGVIVNSSGNIVTGGIFLSGLSLSGSFVPDIDGTYTGSGTVSVSGNVTATGYDAIFLGYRVTTGAASNIVAQDTVAIGAGSTMLFQPLDTERVYVQTAGTTGTETGIDHAGTINASSTMMKADGNIYSLAINQRGVIKATSCTTTGGRIKLIADPKANSKGAIEMSGSILRECTTAGNGPTVEIYGHTVGLLDGSSITVNGVNGGNITIGTSTTYPTNNVHIHSGATITTTGTTGNGGNVIFYGGSSLLYLGTTNVSSTSGNAGNITATGTGYLGVNGSANLGSTSGTNGIFTANGPLIKVADPTNHGTNFAASDYTYTALDSIFTGTSLEGILGTGNVVISGSDIDVETNDVTWSSGNRLHLIATNQIDITKLFTMTGTTSSGTDVVTLTAPIVNVTAASTVGVRLTSGDIAVDASNILHLQGATAGLAHLHTDDGDVNVSFGNNLRMRGTGGEARIEGNRVVINSKAHGTGDVSLRGEPCGTAKINASEHVHVGQTFNPQHMEIIAGSCGSGLVTGITGAEVRSTLTGNLTVQGGADGTGNIGQIQTLSGSRKDIILNAASHYFHAGGSGTNNSAKVLNHSNDGHVSITSSRDVELRGGGTSTTSSVAEVTGKTVGINAAEDVELRAGHGSSAHAAVYGHNGVTVDADNHILMTAGDATHTHARVEANSGDVTLNAGKNIQMHTGESVLSDTYATTNSGTVALTSGQDISMRGSCDHPNLSYVYSDGDDGHVTMNATGNITRVNNTDVDALGTGNFTYTAASYSHTSCPGVELVTPITAPAAAAASSNPASLPKYYNYDGMYEFFYRMEYFGIYDWYLFHSNDFWLKHTYTAPD